MTTVRRYSAGDTVEDLCRVCKMVRDHRVLVTGGDGLPLRVICDHCGSQHNYRHGGPAQRTLHPTHEPADRALPLVTERERSATPMSTESTGDAQDLETLLRRIIREEAGLTPVAPAPKWRGGDLVLRPGREELQEKSWPIETFLHKIVMVRNRLRTLEQQVNASDLPDDAKIKLQGYITACYGSLTSFNVLFADEDDQFRGGGK
jgi:hypothetical protein